MAQAARPLILTAFLCATAIPAYAVEPWIMVEKFTFDTNPVSTRGQGVTTDGTHWYFSGTNAIDITDHDFNSIRTKLGAIDPSLANPFPDAPKGLNHIGDIDYSDGYLYISLDSSARDPVTGENYNTPVFAIYNASDLSYTGRYFALQPPHGTHDIASWVAVDGKKGLAYGMTYDNSTEIAVYNISDGSFKEYIPLSQKVDQAQGGKILDGYMYFSSDSDKKALYRANLTTGEVEQIGDLTTPGDQEVEGLSFGMTKDGWSLYVLNREQFDPSQPEDIGFYRYLRPYGNALSGEVHSSVKGAFIQDSIYLDDAVNQRLRSAFSAVGTTASEVTSYDENGLTGAIGNTESLAFWSQAIGATSTTEGKGYAADFDHTTGGIVFGADAQAGSWRLGAMAGYSRTNFDVDARTSSGSSDNVHLGVYGGTEWGPVGFRTGLFYSSHDISTKRDVIFPAFSETLSADYDARTTQAFAEFSYRMDYKDAAFEPFANLSYTHLNSDAFSEKGGTIAALTSGDSSMNTAFTTLGVRASTDIALEDAKATVRGMVGWRHAYGDVTPSSNLVFNSDASFDSVGAPIAQNALTLEAGLDFNLAKNATIGVSYSGQIAGDTQDHAGKINFNVSF